MAKRFLLILLTLFVLGCQPKDVSYVHYHNARFGFDLDYPSFMTKDPPPENGDGIRCTGKGFEIVAYGCLNMDTVRHPERQGIYKTSIVNNPDGTISLEKTAYFLDTDNGDIDITLYITYPQGQVDEAVIEHIAESFCLKLDN